MKNLTLLLIAILSFTISTKAAPSASGKEVVLCGEYDQTTGIPSDINKAWDIEASGSYVYVIYTQDKTIREELSLYVDKKNTSGSYIAYGTHYFDNDIKTSPKKWAMYDLKFTEDGDYRISVMGKSDDALAVTYANIGYMKEKDDASSLNKKKLEKNADDVVDTYYYEDSKTTFGESIDGSGDLTGEATTFKLSGGQKEFKAKVEQTKDLKLTSVSVNIYNGEDYKDVVSKLSYDVASKEWNYISVPIKVTKKGKYVVDFYNQDDIFINSGYFEIK